MTGVPFDPALPGFTGALDAPRVADWVSGNMLPCELVLTRFELARFRYRPGQRAILSYQAEVQNRQTGRHWQTWYTGHVRSAANVKQRISGSSRSVFCDALGMSVVPFPEDKRIPGLAEFLVTPLMERLGRHVGANDVVITPIRYRPGLTATFKVSAASGQHSHCVYAKLHGSTEAMAKSAEIARLVQEGFGLRPHVSIAAQIDAIQPLRATIYAEAPGHSLLDIFCADVDVAGPCEEIGRGLAALHMASPAPLSFADPTDLEKAAIRSASLIEWIMPEISSSVRELLRRIRLRPRFLTAPTHCDLKPEHIFLSAEGVQFIDADGLCAGDPMLDLGGLLVRLSALEYTNAISRRRIGEAQRALASGYLANVPRTLLQSLEAGSAFGALLTAVHFIQRLLPGWRQLVPAILAEAEAVLEYANRSKNSQSSAYRWKFAHA